MRHRIRFLLLVTFCSFLMMGNAAAPWAACEGKVEGDPCDPGSYSCSSRHGTCRIQPNCTDSPGNSVNECLICQSGEEAGTTPPGD
jgi:hypothetical protein